MMNFCGRFSGFLVIYKNRCKPQAKLKVIVSLDYQFKVAIDNNICISRSQTINTDLLNVLYINVHS